MSLLPTPYCLSRVLFTAGYPVPSTNTLQLYQAPSLHVEGEHEVLQECVGELGQLAAYIALDLKTATQPKVAQARVHFESLNEWHRTLPPPMQLSRLSLADPLAINWHSKRSLLQLHILFLGLFVEPYRNCLLDLGTFRLSNSTIGPEDLGNWKSVEEQCVLAARQSARVASLLQIDDSIRSSCWVSVYVSSGRNRSISANARCWFLDTPATLVAQYFCSALRRNYSSFSEKRLVRTCYTRPHI